VKYFTRSWCTEDDSEQVEYVRRAYAQRLDEIDEYLNPDLRTLARRISLHDCLFKGFGYDSSNDLIEIRLRCGDLQVGYFDLDLRYEEASLVGGYTPELAAVIHDPETQVLYDEVDV
jgi:hypothetical protein